MQLSNSPVKLVLPFASSGNKNSIPVNSQIGITPGAASLADGFPPLTMTPVAAGGVPPSGLDMNGILYELSAIVRWANAGGGYAYDSEFATSDNVGGYPKGARIMRSDGLGYWFNTVDNNETDPDSEAASGWVPDFTSGAASIAMASANVTLTPLQYGKPVIVITGTLTTNLNLIFPTIVNEWTVINNTTGPYAITCKTNSGTGVIVSGVLKILCDSVNIKIVGYSEPITVKTFGAKGDGIADDSSAIQAANDFGLKAIYFPQGEYAASNLTMSVDWVMDASAIIKFNGTTGDVGVTISGNNLKGNVNISGNGGAPSTLVSVTGNHNQIDVNLKNVTSVLGSGVNGGLAIYGNKNTIIANGENFVNSGNTNGSMPQLVTFGGSADGNILPIVSAKDVQSALITYSTGENSVGQLIVDGAVDNGLYNINGKINIGEMIYHGSDEPAVFSSDANIGTLIVSKAGNSAIGLSNCGKVNIGTLIFSDYVGNGVNSIAKCRTDNVASGSLRIGEILGTVDSGGIFGFFTGTLDSLFIGKAKTRFIYDAATAWPITSWGRLESLKSFDIGEFSISIVDKNNVLTSANQFYAIFPTTNLAKASRIGKFNVAIFNSDEFTVSAAVFRGTNLAQALVDVENGYFQVNVGPYLREVTPSVAEGGVFADAAPAIGTWRRGKRIWNALPSASGSPGWVCTTAGATFKAMANLAA